jgi:hypothetical protein
LPARIVHGDDHRVRDEPFDDAGLIMEVLQEIREDLHYVIRLLEDDDGEEAEENT